MLSLALTLLFTAISASNARTLQSTSDTGVTYLAAEGRSCASVCKKPLVFGSAFSPQAPAYGCRADLDNGGSAFGYQSGSSMQCSAALDGQLAVTTRYSCACLDASATAGLAQPVSGSCAKACTKSIDGQNGISLMNGANYLCMPQSEMGVSNHYGSVGSGCEYESKSAAQSTNAYSCVCSFSSGSSKSVENAIITPTPAPSANDKDFVPVWVDPYHKNDTDAVGNPPESSSVLSTLG